MRSERTDDGAVRPRLPAIGLAAVLGALSLAVPIAGFSEGDLLAAYLGPALGVAALGFPFVVYLLRPSRPGWVAAAVIAPSVTLAVVSVVTGWHNGLTDEPYAMPAFARVLFDGRDPYVSPISVAYSQYGTPGFVSGTYFYLPLLLFLQPFVVSYRWLSVGCWVATVALLRHRPLAALAVGQPFVGLLAASGFNDFPALLLLTVGFVGVVGRPQRWAELLALGTKQFAAGFVLVYYAVRRDAVGLLVSGGVTAAFLLPFLFWNAGALACPILLVWPPGCSGASAAGTAEHLNYWVWPIWVAAVFFEPLRRAFRAATGRGGPDRTLPPGDRSRTEPISAAAGPADGEVRP